VLDPALHMKRSQRGEAEAGAAGLEGRNDLAHIVADEAEAGGGEGGREGGRKGQIFQ